MKKLLVLLSIFLLASSSTLAANHTIDTFVGTAGTALESHTPDSGGPWTNTSGDVGHLALSGMSRLSQVTSTNPNGAWTVPVGATDQYVQVSVTTGTSWALSINNIVVRFQDLSNFYGVGHNGATNFYIRKVVGGTSTILTNITDSTSPGDIYKFEVVGNSLKLYKNGSLIGSTTDSSLSSGTDAGIVTTSTGGSLNMFTRFEADAAGGTVTKVPFSSLMGVDH